MDCSGGFALVSPGDDVYVDSRGAASWEIFLTMEPPLFNSCHRLRALEPTTIWVI